MDRVAEPHRFARDESQLPGSIGRDAERIRRGFIMVGIGGVELREKRFRPRLRNFKKQNQGTEIGAVDARVVTDWRRAARVERIAVPEVDFEGRVAGQVRVANRDAGIDGAYPGVARHLQRR